MGKPPLSPLVTGCYFLTESTNACVCGLTNYDTEGRPPSVVNKATLVLTRLLSARILPSSHILLNLGEQGAPIALLSSSVPLQDGLNSHQVCSRPSPAPSSSKHLNQPTVFSAVLPPFLRKKTRETPYCVATRPTSVLSRQEDRCTPYQALQPSISGTSRARIRPNLTD